MVRNRNSVRPKGIAARAVAERAGVASPAVLRHVANDVLKADVDTATLVFGHVTAERLLLLAEELERIKNAEAPTIALAELQQRLNKAANEGTGIALGAGEVRRYRTALEREAGDTVRRLAASGLAAAAAQGEAEHWMKECLEARTAAARAAELAERAKNIALRERDRVSAVHGAVRRMIADVTASEAQHAELVFEFSNQPHPDGLSVEDAMELAHVIDRTRDDATGTAGTTR